MMKMPTVPELVLQISLVLAHLVTPVTAQCVWTLTSACCCREWATVANMLIVTMLKVALHAIALWDSMEMESTVLVSIL